MELSYNLTPQDLKRGLFLHERRPKGVLAVVRKAERLWQYEEAVKAVFEELEPAKEYELEF